MTAPQDAASRHGEKLVGRVEGATLAKRLADEGPLAPADAIHVALQIASSLRDAHQQGLVQRDLEPGNVMFAPQGGDPLFVRALDFGLVRVVGREERDAQLAQSGVTTGSPRYMSPEQVKAHDVDARTDIYSFGALLYHALTGAPPFRASSALEAMNHHVYTEPPPFAETWPECPASARLEALVMRCLRKDPGERFQTMDAVMEALRACGPEPGAALGSGSSTSTPTEGGAPGAEAPEAGADAEGDASGLRHASAPRSPARIAKTVRIDDPPASAAPLPAAPEPEATRRWGGLGLALAGFAVVFAVGAAAMMALLVPPEEEAAPAPSPVTERAPAVELAPSPPALEPAPAPPSPRPLMLRTDPTGATVRRDGHDLGDTPIPLLIEHGERWTIEISHEGHETRTVAVVGGQPELTVHLSPTEAPRPSPPPRPAATEPEPPPPAPSPSSAAGAAGPEPRSPELDDPWAH